MSKEAKFQKFNPEFDIKQQPFPTYKVQPYYTYSDSIDELITKFMEVGNIVERPIIASYNKKTQSVNKFQFLNFF